MHRLKCTFVGGQLAALLLAGRPALAQSPPATLERWGRDMQAHPGQERPHLLATTLGYLQATTADEQHLLLGNQGGITGFYHSWLAEHPAERPTWQAALAAVPGPADWRQFVRGLADVPAPTHPLRRGPSPSHNDYLWGSYFATGRPAYLDSVVAQCRYAVAQPAAAGQQQLFSTTGWSALWSLQANARQDKVVARYLRQPAIRAQLRQLEARLDATR